MVSYRSDHVTILSQNIVKSVKPAEQNSTASVVSVTLVVAFSESSLVVSHSGRTDPALSSRNNPDGLRLPFDAYDTMSRTATSTKRTPRRVATIGTTRTVG